jgi:hypothetical protein
LRAEIVSYARSCGLFVGVALDGSVIVYDRRANAEYVWDVRPETALLSAALLARLTELSGPPFPPAALLVRPPEIVPGTTPEPPGAPLPPPGHP